MARQSFREAKKKGSDEEIRSRCGEFLTLLREHSRLKRASGHKEKLLEATEARKCCHQDFWRFSKQLFDGSSSSNISPGFSALTTQEFFKEQFSSQALDFAQPDWMPSPASPKFTMAHLVPISEDELSAAIKRSRSSSAPSRLDQISYHIFKSCPSLKPALLDLFNSILLEGVISRGWMLFSSWWEECSE